MDRRLVDVSQAGNIQAFHALLDDEPNILDYIDQVPCTKTPLHIAILAQKTEFAKQIANFKPSFITKLDSSGYNPIHLAAETGQVDIVRILLKILVTESDAHLLRGKSYKTPLHFAVISGKIEVVKCLLDEYPDCVFEVTVQDETVFHLAEKNKQLGIVVFLLEWLNLANKPWEMPKVCSVFTDRQVSIDVGCADGLLNWKDDEGNSVLHLATMTKQHQMVEALLCSSNNPCGNIQVDVNSSTGKELSAFDFFLQLPAKKREANIQEIFHKARAMITKQIMIPTPPSKFETRLHQYNPHDSLYTNNLTLCNSQTTSNLYFGIDVVFAIIMAISCLVTANNINFYPFIIFNMLGFFLSFSILLSALILSPLRNVLVVILVIILGSYVYLMFSGISSKDRVFFGGVFLSVGAATAKIHAKMQLHVLLKQIKIPMYHQQAKQNHSLQLV